jgi:hypothetical protein
MMINDSYKFRYWSAILRESTKTKEQVQHAKSGIDCPHCHFAETCRSVMTLVMNFILWCVFYCVVLSAFVGWYIEFKKMHYD